MGSAEAAATVARKRRMAQEFEGSYSDLLTCKIHFRGISCQMRMLIGKPNVCIGFKDFGPCSLLIARIPFLLPTSMATRLESKYYKIGKR